MLYTYVLESGLFYYHTELEPPIKDTLNKGQPLYKDKIHVPKIIKIPMVPIHFLPPKEDKLSTKDKMVGPKVSFVQRFHYTDYL